MNTGLKRKEFGAHEWERFGERKRKEGSYFTNIQMIPIHLRRKLSTFFNDTVPSIIGPVFVNCGSAHGK
jgi:hypothetical protein